MAEFLADYYNLLKSIHIMMCMAWMAGLFYLPRLFVYHTQTVPGTGEYDRFVVMEHKLLTIIMRPAMIAVWLTGLSIAWAYDYWFDFWFLAKMSLSVPMTAVHLMNEVYAVRFARGQNLRSEVFFRVWNEAPTLLMIAIVLLVIYKPA